MLTLRLHLDPMRDENGPLVVVPKSHRDLTEPDEDIRVIHCDTGDLFVMRPLLLHGSRNGIPTTNLHRRVVHLEIAPSSELPRPYQWNRFERINSNPRDGTKV
jgi:ectoine hydroxylase-related dioxygenase (phytanoyl-CoA dioxygenase family)